MSSINLKLVEILRDCDGLQFVKHFADLSLESLYRFSLKDLQALLRVNDIVLGKKLKNQLMQTEEDEIESQLDLSRVVRLDVFDMLQSCDSVLYIGKFVDLTMEALYRHSLKDLLKLLPSNPEAMETARKIRKTVLDLEEMELDNVDVDQNDHHVESQNNVQGDSQTSASRTKLQLESYETMEGIDDDSSNSVSTIEMSDKDDNHSVSAESYHDHDDDSSLSTIDSVNNLNFNGSVSSDQSRDSDEDEIEINHDDIGFISRRPSDDHLSRGRGDDAMSTDSDDDDVMILRSVKKKEDAPHGIIRIKREKSSDSESDSESEDANNNNMNCRNGKKDAVDSINEKEIFKLSPLVPFHPDPDIIKRLSKHKRPHVKIVQKSTEPLKKNVKKVARFSSHKLNHRKTDASQFSWTEWKLYFRKFGDKVYALDCIDWSWDKLNENEDPLNLNLILSRVCCNIHQLSILSNAIESSGLSKPFTLPCLEVRKLIIKHSGKINYGRQLRAILRRSERLESIEGSFTDEQTLHDVLDCFDQPFQLKALRSLEIRNDEEDVALLQNDILKLSTLKAPGLEKLVLGYGLFRDVTGSNFENMVKRFPKLKSIIIHGCFSSESHLEPQIMIKFPAMRHLELIDFGKSYKFATVFQSLSERPGRIPQVFIKEPEPDFLPLLEPPTTRSVSSDNNQLQSPRSVVEESSVVQVDDGDDYGGYFPVILTLPDLPCLKTLNLGSWYNLHDLDFKRMPNLIQFQVGSPWTRSVNLTEMKERGERCRLVTQLQLPDYLKNCAVVRDIPYVFPNVKKCIINLPTVQVLRTFFKCMENNSALTELQLKTQFDFASSLEICLMDKPSEVIQSSDEKQKLGALKMYKHWPEYVKVHNVELPEQESWAQLEDPNNFGGLGALKKLRRLVLCHIPRQLRPPQGDWDWSSDNCQFSLHLIGFRKYPLSKKLPIGDRVTVECIDYDYSALSNFKKMKRQIETSYFEIDAYNMDTSFPSTLSEEPMDVKAEKSEPDGSGPSSSKTSAPPINICDIPLPPSPYTGRNY